MIKQPKKTQNVKVVVRCRPISSKEKQEKRKIIVSVSEPRSQIVVGNPDGQSQQRTFSYDNVFGMQSQQQFVFNQIGLPIVQNVLEGYNGTIFAYGQTGTGKTFTMEGDVKDHVFKGIIPRSFDHVFKVIAGTPGLDFLVRCSMLQMYNQQLLDLLVQGTKQKLQLHETPDKGVFVKKLMHFNIKSSEEMLSKLLLGSKNRHTSATKMNEKSSRSHSLFQITIQMAQTLQNGQQKIKRGKLNLVDLAGSQRLKKTQAQDEVRNQGIYINLSLTTLGIVIYNLTDPNNPHVPFRDSKLTRLLQDSLGGNTKTLLIANIGPADYNFQQTINTLRFASRAKQIKNKPKINQDPKDARIRELQEQKQKLLRQLMQRRKGLTGQPISSSGTKQQQKGDVSDFDRRLAVERNKIKNATKQQKKKVQEQMIKIQNQKKNYMKMFQSKNKENKMVQEEISKLQSQLKQKNQILLRGDKLKAQTREFQKMTLKAKQELQDRKLAERRLKQQQEQRAKDHVQIKTKYDTLKQEIDAKTKKLNQLIKKVKQAKEQSNQIRQFRMREKDELMQQNRNIQKQIKLTNLIIQNFIPQVQVNKLKQRLQFNEEIGDWVIRKDYLIHKPPSAFKFKRPLCQYTLLAINQMDANPRHRPDNVLVIDLEVIDRTTEDIHQSTTDISDHVKECINITIEQDQQALKQIAKAKRPSVYVNPQTLVKQKQKKENPGRLKSAVKKNR